MASTHLDNKVFKRTRTEQGVYRLLGLAVMCLYEDPEDVQQTYFDHKYHQITPYLDECITKQRLPKKTPAQDAIKVLLPQHKKAYIYIGALSPDEPSHCIAIKRDDKHALWGVTSRYVIESPFPPKDGVFANWPTISVDVNAKKTPVWTRIFGGGSDTAYLSQEIVRDYECRIRASHAYIVAKYTRSATENKFTVLANGEGRVTFKVDEHLGDGWVVPFGFVPLKGRPYSVNDLNRFKERCRVWGCASSEDLWMGALVRTTLPQSRTHLGELERGFGLVANLLKGGVVPLLGVEERNGILSMCGLSYDPESKQTTIVIYGRGRNFKNCVALLHTGSDLAPSIGLMRVLRDHLQDKTTDKIAYCRESRRAQIARFLDKFGIDTAHKADVYFKKYGITLTLQGRRVLDLLPWLGVDEVVKQDAG